MARSAHKLLGALTLLICILAGGVFYFFTVHQERASELVGLAVDMEEVMEDLDVSASLDTDLALKDIRLAHGGEGGQDWTLTAERANYLEQPGVIKLERPRIAYTMAGGDLLTVTAPEGLVRQQAKTAHLTGGVDGELSRGADSAESANDQTNVPAAPATAPTAGEAENATRQIAFTGEELYYDGEAETVRITGAIRLWGKGIRASADEVLVDLGRGALSAQGNVRAELASEGAFLPSRN